MSDWYDKAAVVVQALSKAHQTIATCESLTAGLLAATVAEVPGASAVLRGGLVTYATELKQLIAGVPAQLLAEYGPVSAKTAQAMAVGAHQRCEASWGIGLTGVAGPTEQDGHPVGEVWVGIARPDHTSAAFLAAELMPECSTAGLLQGDRGQIRSYAVAAALELLARELI